MPSPIVIADYDPDWPVQFEKIRSQVAEQLGPVAVTIEHVGSTSVPGLAAKPIIDIDIVVASDDDVPQAIELLRPLGYEHEGDLGVTGREAFAVPPGAYQHHLYVVTVGGRELKRHVAFRDRLRRDSQARREYEALKRRLAAQPGVDRSNYSQLKSDFIEKVLAEELGPEH